MPTNAHLHQSKDAAREQHWVKSDPIAEAPLESHRVGQKAYLRSFVVHGEMYIRKISSSLSSPNSS